MPSSAKTLQFQRKSSITGAFLDLKGRLELERVGAAAVTLLREGSRGEIWDIPPKNAKNFSLVKLQILCTASPYFGEEGWKGGQL